MSRPLPKAGDRIHCDPNRDEGDTPGRWSNPNRRTAIVLAVLDDDDAKVLVLKRWLKHKRYWHYWAEHEMWWRDTNWDMGPLPQPPRASR